MNCKRWMAWLAVGAMTIALLCGCHSEPDGQTTESTTSQTAQQTGQHTDADTPSSGDGTTGSSAGTTTKKTTGKTAATSAGDAPETVPTASGVDTDDQFTDRDQKTEYDASQAMPVSLKDGATVGKGVSVKGNTITVVKEGAYVFSGSLSNGRIVVDTDKNAKVHLIFNGVSVACSGYGALYVKQADKVVLTLNKGTKNTLTTTAASTVGVEENVDGTLFSKDDFTVNGEGSLTVTGPNHGIVCKADLVFVGGNVSVEATGHAVQAKKSARFGGGSFSLTAGKDGIHVENPDDATEGYLYVEGGRFTVNSDGDGFSAATLLQVSGGEGTLVCGGGAAAAPGHSGGMGGWPNWGSSSSTATDDTSNKGMKGGTSLLMQGGTWNLDTADDGLHANGNLTMEGGMLTISTGDDGLHADSVTAIKGGVLNVTKSYEGIEGNAVEIMGGTISVVASDDGINAAGGNDGSGMGGRPDQFSGDSSCYIRISGGKTYINASGDGVDANNCLYIEGGETYVSGPTSSGNGALDYDRSASVTGGIFVAAGSQGMAQGFTTATNQCGVLVTVGSTTGEILLKDSDGNVLFRWTPEKTYATVAFTCPGLVKGETYTLSVGGKEQQIEMTDWIVGSGGGMGGGPGGGGGRPGRPW